MKVSTLVLIVASMITTTIGCADMIVSNKDNQSQALWLMLAHRCNEPEITEYADLTEEHFFMTDENGKNIYEIALQIHKDTQSIPCARMAITFQKYAEKIHKALHKEDLVLSEQETEFRRKQHELNKRINKLDSVVSTFEKSHK